MDLFKKVETHLKIEPSYKKNEASSTVESWWLEDPLDIIQIGIFGILGTSSSNGTKKCFWSNEMSTQLQFWPPYCGQ